jgi:hypothetical protein
MVLTFYNKNNKLNINPKRNGKPFEKMGRKANGLKTLQSMAAGLPK